METVLPLLAYKRVEEVSARGFERFLRIFNYAGISAYRIYIERERDEREITYIRLVRAYYTRLALYH